MTAHEREREATDVTYWRCTRCDGEGMVRYDRHASVYEVVERIRDSHGENVATCLFDLARVRVSREPFPDR